MLAPVRDIRWDIPVVAYRYWTCLCPADVQPAFSVRLLVNQPSSQSGLASPVPLPLMRCFNIADGLNTITRRGEIGTSVPVFGLRQMG
jgi:hypothetical protein